MQLLQYLILHVCSRCNAQPAHTFISHPDTPACVAASAAASAARPCGLKSSAGVLIMSRHQKNPSAMGDTAALAWQQQEQQRMGAAENRYRQAIETMHLPTSSQA
jgi:hypothetical protein